VNDVRTFEAAQFQTQRGGVLPVAKLAYLTLGSLNAARDNAVVVPSWFSGTCQDVAMAMTGNGRALDPDTYFLILPDLLGSGQSSSPSNTPAPHDRGRFPNVTIRDNVRLQHMLVTEHFGIDRLRLVTSCSLGAAQTYEWVCQFPDMVRAACPIIGSARTAEYNRVFLMSLRRILELDPVFDDGFYSRPPVAGLRAFAAVYAGWGTSEPFFRNREYREFGSATWQDHVAAFWEALFLPRDANDLLCQIRTWEQADISANEVHGGDFEAALRSITARTIVMPSSTDRYFPPADSEFEAERIPGAECRIITSTWGHMATINPEVLRLVDATLNELLNG